jgi:hypothetical protein
MTKQHPAEAAKGSETGASRTFLYLTPMHLARLRAPLAVLVAYVVASGVFTLVAGHEGLLSPFGAFHPLTLALGLVVLALRLFVFFLGVPWVVWRLLAPVATRET